MYYCTNCWNEYIKWVGQCPHCKEWWTIKEFKESKSKSTNSWVSRDLITLDSETTDISDTTKIPTKSTELNNLLSGGITKWSIILLSWEPGIGKSTLSLQLWDMIDSDIIYISWEENESQILQRAQRLDIKSKKMSLLIEHNLENILATLEKKSSDIVIIDSISVISSDNVSGVAGSLSQVRYLAEKLVDYGKSTNTTMIIIWHVNKDWNLAWPKTLEHLVDTVLFFEWDRYEDIRILRSLKNRFWSTWEVAIFQMWERGLIDIPNPGLEFTSKNHQDVIWSTMSATIEWNRALIVEIEALTSYTKFGYPKRSTRWVYQSKLDLIIAVLWKYTSINLDSSDVYINIVRWLKVDESGIDLSIASSIISSKLKKPVPRDSIFIWEISLTGLVKNSIHLEKRVIQASRLWFKNIYIPSVDIKPIDGVNIIKVVDILDLVKYLWVEKK